MMKLENNEPRLAREKDKKNKGVKIGKKLPSSPEDYEVLIPRPILAKEIIRVKKLPQILGWSDKNIYRLP